MDEIELSNALEDLCEVLESFFGKGVRDVSGLKQAICRLKIRTGNPKQKEYPLSVNIARLSFDIPTTHKHTLPIGVVDSILTLSIKMGFREPIASFYCINEMNIDFELSANDKEGRPIKSAWHLDYHDVKGDEHFSHPQFHFQFGGKKLRESLRVDCEHFNTGELLLMESPRLMHPPMDPILAIDFIFSNFLGEASWKALRQKRSFIKIHKISKDAFWRPYFEGISNYLSNPTSSKQALGLQPSL
ncbi:hypothetical protein C9I43_16340 [Shewanella morhuae]|uniref:Uncharacterized protein n=1 Tax=Shewanella morhuae TaxID=365591 RepID=A0ABX5HR36_9GAMM|nr:hypothetical protein [Shewanella morhuae]PTA48649.1 hypothetical protein C9I43_16340 [Shewanella morhuae]